ncbi:elongation factor Ts [bacterium]|jgi:elongation factor Ts|nr:elongation factor Ts [bacterium]
MSITAAQVKELREKTGVGMMDCKKALTETNGDMDAAIKHLREKGIAKAEKKADRETKEGRVFTVISGNTGAILELNCETDFVGNNDAFIQLGNQLAKVVLNTDGITSETIDGIEVGGKTVKDVIADGIARVGENLTIGNFERFVTEGVVTDYIHQNGKIGVLVGFSGTIEDETGRDVAMQVAALNPLYTRPEEVPTDEIDQEKDVIRKQAENEGRPAQVIDKMVEGKINKFYKEVCLLEQSFVKDDKKAIKQILPEGVTIEGFRRYSLG